MKATVSIVSKIRMVVSKTILLILICFLGSSLYLSTVGFPAWLLQDVQELLSRGDFAITAKAMKLDILHGIVVKDALVYRKYVVGPAAFEAKKIVVTFSLEDLIAGKSFIRKVSLTNGEVRPKMVHSSVSATKKVGAPVDLNVFIELHKFVIAGVSIEQLAFNVDSDGVITKYNDMHGQIGAGKMRGSVAGQVQINTKTSTLDGSIRTECDLHAIIPALQSIDVMSVVKLLKRFDFGSQHPRCEFNFKKVFTNDSEFKLDGKFWMAESTYKGVDILRADGKIGIDLSKTNALVNVSDLFVVRQEGIVQGNLTVLPMDEVIRIDAASTIDPKALSQMVGVLEDKLATLCEFNGPTRIDAKGVVGYKDIEKSDFEMTVDCRNVKVGPILLDNCFFKSRMLGLTNTFTDIRGSLCGGTLGGNAELVLPNDIVTNMQYNISVRVDDMNFAKFVDGLSTNLEEEYSGKMWAKLDLSGTTGSNWTKTALGQGAIGIRHGRVFMLPIFGGFSSLMVKIIPGLDFVLRQGDVSADFVIADGKVHSDKIKIEGDVLSLLGKGDIYFDKRVDYDIQVKLMKEHTLVGKLLRGLTYIISKILEFNLSGTLDDPQWSMNTMNLPGALLRKLGIMKDNAPNTVPVDK